MGGSSWQLTWIDHDGQVLVMQAGHVQRPGVPYGTTPHRSPLVSTQRFPRRSSAFLLYYRAKLIVRSSKLKLSPAHSESRVWAHRTSTGSYRLGTRLVIDYECELAHARPLSDSSPPQLPHLLALAWCAFFPILFTLLFIQVLPSLVTSLLPSN